METKEQARLVEGDVVETVRKVGNLVEDIEKANHAFDSEVKRIYELKSEKSKEYTEKYNKAVEGVTVEEKAKLGESITTELRKELNEIQKLSKAGELDVEVTVELSDEKHELLKKAIRAVIDQWPNAKEYVEIATAIDGAEEV